MRYLHSAMLHVRLDSNGGEGYDTYCVHGHMSTGHTHTLSHCISPHVPDTHERILRTEITEEISSEGVGEGGGCDECYICVGFGLSH
jgi:hypothetical protein